MALKLTGPQRFAAVERLQTFFEGIAVSENGVDVFVSFAENFELPASFFDGLDVAVEPVEPAVEPAVEPEPSVEPVEPVVEPVVEPAVEPVEPEPSVEPVEPVEPAVEPAVVLTDITFTAKTRRGVQPTQAERSLLGPTARAFFVAASGKVVVNEPPWSWDDASCSYTLHTAVDAETCKAALESFALPKDVRVAVKPVQPRPEGA
jgi:hypothetical protein